MVVGPDGLQTATHKIVRVRYAFYYTALRFVIGPARLSQVLGAGRKMVRICP